jgi:outer membrane cobalamin receptor
VRKQKLVRISTFSWKGANHDVRFRKRVSTYQRFDVKLELFGLVDLSIDYNVRSSLVAEESE